MSRLKNIFENYHGQKNSRSSIRTIVHGLLSIRTFIQTILFWLFLAVWITSLYIQEIKALAGYACTQNQNITGHFSVTKFYIFSVRRFRYRLQGMATDMPQVQTYCTYTSIREPMSFKIGTIVTYLFIWKCPAKSLKLIVTHLLTRLIVWCHLRQH